MDTKLKNRHKIGVLLIIITIIAAAASMIGLYPYIQRNAKAYAARTVNTDRFEEERAGASAIEFMNCTYGIWQEYVQDKEGYLMTPVQVFYPGVYDALNKRTMGFSDPEADGSVTTEDTGSSSQTVSDLDIEENNAVLDSVKNSINERGNVWKEHFREMRPNMSYRLLDQEGNLLMQNTGNGFTPADGIVTVKLVFDNLGRMQVKSVDTDIESAHKEEIIQALGEGLGDYYFYDPMENEYDYQFYASRDAGLRFAGPKNVTYEFAVNRASVVPDRQLDGWWDQVRPYYYDNTTATVACILLAIVSLLALFFPCFRSLQIGQEKIFRAPFEIVTAIGLLAAGMLFSTLPAEVIASTMNGKMADELVRAGFLPQAADFLVWLINFGAWAIGFALIYWGITCIRSLFVIGPVRYLKERTLTGRFFCWIARKWRNMVRRVTTIDWRSKDTKQIAKLVILNFVVILVISCFWFFGIPALILYSVILFVWLKKYYSEMQQKYTVLLESISQIADGNLNLEIEEDLGIFEPIKEELSVIQYGFKNAVDKEVKSQRMKTELITNVSHDLKTPLTAIITYVNLLKQDDVTEEERQNYIGVLEQKSMRLKVLIEDLFDISKATSRSMPLNLVEMDLVNLIKQVRLELADRIEASGIDFRWNLPEEKVMLTLDSQKTYRIFENLLVNITKYAMPGTRAYVDLTVDDWVTATFRNISATEITVSPQELMERFVRGDESRNTEGSGLGMAIAKSFVEVQGGEMEVEVEADLFRVTVRWRA